MTTGDIDTIIVQKQGDAYVYASESENWSRLNEGDFTIKHVGETRRIDF